MMSKIEILNRLRDSVENLDVKGAEQACGEALDARIPAYEAVTDGMAKGINIVSEKFEAGEYFLLELIMAGEAMKAGLKILEPHLKVGEIESSGRVVIGTAKDDLHDVGKNIVVALLKSAGFNVVDLGVDVPPEKFVEAVEKEKPDIVGMSSLITLSMPAMEATIGAIEKADLRKRIKVIVGGAPVTEEYAEKIGADAFGKDAVEGVRICKTWMGGR